MRPPAQPLERPAYPSGFPLTDSAQFTAHDGVCWLVYIEGVPLPRTRAWARHVRLPGRRLRFDSAAASRVLTPVPAGSPFLTDARLQDLLDRSGPVEAVIPHTAASAGLARRLVASAGRSVRHSLAALSAARWHWRQLEAGAADRLDPWVARLLGGRPRSRV